MLDLLDEVGYGRITVRDLTDRADVARSTFYSHFDSKEDLLFSGFDAWLESLSDVVDAEPSTADGGPPGRFRFSRPLLEHARTQRRFFRAVILRGSDHRVRRRLMGVLADVARLELDRADIEEPDRSARAHMVAGAFLGALEWWSEAGRGMDAAAVDEVFQRAVAGAFEA